MALSLTTIRNNLLPSLYGRRFGIRKLVAGDDTSEHAAGLQGFQHTITDATSDTTGTAIKGYGWTTVDTTTDDTWTLNNPIPGVYKTIYTGSTSTGIRTIKRANATFAIESSASSTLTTILAQGGGLVLTLFGVSSALYAVVSRSVTSTEISLNGTT